MLKKFGYTKFTFLAVVMGLLLILAACGGDNNNNNEGADANNNADVNNNDDNDDENDDSLELGDENISIPYVNWAGSTSRTPVLAQTLEEVGYDVEIDQVEGGPMFTETATDEDTMNATGWFPATHAEYEDEYGDDIEIYEDANLVDQAPLSLTVPEYMMDEYDIESIEDLKDNDEVGEAVDWTITGIDPGAGIMNNTEEAIETYELDEWDLQESSESAMIGDLEDKYENEEPIIITGWEPHWIFADMDLEMLEDPEEIYGGEGDQIQLVFNKDFQDEHPAAYEIATRMAEDWSDELENEMMPDIFVEDRDNEEVAEEWIEDNRDLVDDWIEGIE